MRIIGVDPGKTTGWVEFEDDKLLLVGEQDLDDFIINLDISLADVFIVENYRVRPASMNKGWAHEWSSPEALQVIGAIKLRVYQQQAKLVLQEPSIKPVGYGFAGMPYDPKKKGKSIHHKDALAHVAYYLVKSGKVKPGWLQQQNKS